MLPVFLIAAELALLFLARVLIVRVRRQAGRRRTEALVLDLARRSPGTVKGFLREIAATREVRVAAEDPVGFQVAITAAMPHRVG